MKVEYDAAIEAKGILTTNVYIYQTTMTFLRDAKENIVSTVRTCIKGKAGPKAHGGKSANTMTR